MKIITTFTLFFMLNSFLYCQNNWEFSSRIERNNFYLLEGNIDNKYPIRMYLEETWDYCGNGNAKWDPRIVKGWYEYRKYNNRIPLLGSKAGYSSDYFIKLFVPKNPLDNFVTDDCSLPDYKEQFIDFSHWNLDTMKWSKSNQDTAYEVVLKTIHHHSWKTQAFITLSVNGINLKDINLSKLSKNEFIDSIWIASSAYVKNNFYSILRFGHYSFPGYIGNGHCGCGWEGWCAFLQIDQDYTIKKFELYQEASCLSNNYVKCKFNPDHPEYGITVEKY